MLAAMRSAIAELLPDTCSIINITRAPDGYGGQTETRGTVSSVAFRLDVTSGKEQVSGGAMTAFASYKGSLPYDTTVSEANQILHNGIYYAVTAVNNNQSWNAVKRVDLERI
jgi:hypothetical protein